MNRHPVSRVRTVSYLLIGAVLLTSCGSPTPEQIEVDIARYPLLGVANNLCTNLPKPAGFRLVDKKIASNSESALITFRFRSNLDPTQVVAFYSAILGGTGWTRRSFLEARFGGFESISFAKDYFDISVNKRNFDDANYSVSCMVWEEVLSAR